MLGAVAVGVALLMGGVAIGGFGSRFLSQRITQQEEVIAQQEQVVTSLKEETPLLDFQVKSKSNDKVSVHIHFNGSEDIKEYKLPGQCLTLQFCVFHLEDETDSRNAIAFPYRLYTEKIPPSKGVCIFEDSMQGGDIPPAYRDVPLSLKDTERMQEIVRNLKSEESFPEREKDFSTVFETSSYPFRVNRVYEVVMHSKGGITCHEK